MKINSEQEMLDAGKAMADKVSGVIELIGDVGVGKTTFVRGLAEGLGIKEPVTSPSFTISKAYALPDGRTLVHYDFYRLNDPGLLSEDLVENLANPKNIVVIEWSDSVKDVLPENHTIINIKYNDDGSRELEVLK
ncbi:tRNA (adenosine(37)-N6)-threonylcarbamoyltransferase complex ATPase subunit type 1 TsaE [Candidatus Saccharibacteria bacterium]|nr:tRNA (adenosine(37)-N6)-threonylcarbamoyltransferase complex ATPase subunit type 1 TsaE [Candidatus Saccharibacteria bacterium]